MQRNEHELEKYLSEFRPREVRPLAVQQPVVNTWVWRLAAAALLLFSIGAGLRYARHGTKTQETVNVQPVRIETHAGLPNRNSILLTNLALENEQEFEAELAAESRRVLPDFQEQQSALHVFSKE